jgi:methionine-rich copper-binding protein CopC
MNPSVNRILLAAALAAGVATPAVAHAFLDTASPRAGESLKASPPRVELHFTEDLEPDFSAIVVTDEAGRDVDAGPVSVVGATMSVRLKTLAPGRYRVTWHAVSVDTHRTQGSYNFVVAP